MIKVGFDISQTAFNGGVAVYTNELAKRFQENKDLDMVYFYSSLRRKYLGGLRNVKRYRLPPMLFEMLFNRWRNVSIEKFIGRVDIFHSSDWTQPPTKAKKVTTYHDLVPLKYPEWSYPKIVEVHRRRLKIVEREIDLVIAVSESTKKDLLKITEIPEEKIVVIYEGVSEQFKPKSRKKIEEFRKKYQLPAEFILAIGGVGERRNLKRIKEASQGYSLVISGTDMPTIPSEEIPLLYCSAKILLYPSLYEGFGLPILEAMSCGIPVITSNVSSMPEIGGDAPLYVDPESSKDIKDKLDNLMEDEKLRQELIKRGFEQAKKFSWEKCAQETAAVYKILVNK